MLVWDNFGIKPCTWLRTVHDETDQGCYRIENIESDDIEKIWHSDKFENIRSSIKNGTYEYCNFDCCCEVQSNYSSFKTLEELKLEYPLIAKYITGEDKKFIGRPLKFNISFDTACNLSCPSCNRTSIPNPESSFKERILNSISLVSKEVRYLYIAGMGEPLFAPHYLKFIEGITSKSFPNLEKIDLQTNLMLLNQKKWDNLPAVFKDKLNTVIISMDGASKKTFEINRRGGNWEIFLDNLRFTTLLKKSGKINSIRLFFVYQSNNYLEMSKAIVLAQKVNADEIFFARVANWNGINDLDFYKIDVANEKNIDHQHFCEVMRNARLIKTDKLKVIFSN